MKKSSKILSVLLALVLAMMMFALTAYATDFILDDTQRQLISVSQSEQFDTVVKNYRDSYGFGIYYYSTDEVDGNLVDFSEDYYKKHCNNDDNGVLLTLAADKYYIHLNGDAEEIFGDADDIWAVFCGNDTYYDAVAAYINYVGTEIVKYYALQPAGELPENQSEPQSVSFTADNGSLPYNTLESDGSLVFDYYDLLRDDEETALETRLVELSSKHGMDIAVVIVDGLDGKTPEAFADDYYDYNGYGQNETYDGVVLLLSMADRDWHFTTTGKAINAFSDKAQDYMFNDNVLSYFGDDDWVGGFNCYVDECDKCLTAFENGKKYPPVGFTVIVKYLFTSTVIGLFVAAVFVEIVKKKYKTVSMKADADDYLVPGSLQITQSYDTFAYKNVTKVPKPDKNSSSGSSTHSSSSGRSHGGSGGKF